MLTQPQPMYEKGDMTRSRWQLAVRRWLLNQQNKPASNDVPLSIVTTSSMPVIEQANGGSCQKSIAPKPAATVSGNVIGVDEKGDCHGSLSAMTGRDKFRRCEFCYVPFEFVRSHAKYCSDTCSTDAHLCRKAFGDGRAGAYIQEYYG